MIKQNVKEISRKVGKTDFLGFLKDEDGLMICRRFQDFANKSGVLFKGTSNLKTDPLISHGKTNEHCTASRHYFN